MAEFIRGPERVLADSPFLRLIEGDFTMPDGSVVQRQIVRHPGAVAIVPIIDDEVILVRQYRAALHREVLEVPAGKCDVQGEPLELTARRELAEEIGFRTGRLERLASIVPSPGFCDEVIHLFAAHDLSPTERDVQTHEEAFMTIERWPFAAAVAAVHSGEIEDAKTMIALLLAAAKR